MCMCVLSCKIIIQVHGSGDTNTSRNSSKAKSKGNHNYKGASIISQSLIFDLSADNLHVAS